MPANIETIKAIDPAHRWLKSHQVRRLLTVPPGTLQNLRINGTLPFAKIGGVIFYDYQDIQRMIEERKQNSHLWINFESVSAENKEFFRSFLS